MKSQIRRLSFLSGILGVAFSFDPGFGIPRRTFHVRRRQDLGTLSSWSVEDDWSSLSSESPENSEPNMEDLLNDDLARSAARRMEAGATTIEKKVSEEDAFIIHAVDEIQNHGFLSTSPSDDPPLYDTGFESYAHSVSFQDEMGQEISMLVNCNSLPEDLLIEQGRALPPLTEEEKNDVSQLVQESADGELEMTAFFREAISNMFHRHATNQETSDGAGNTVLDASGVASWMTKCLSKEEKGGVGPHSKRVRSTLSKFGSYGSGYLTEEDFQALYLSAVASDLKGAKRSTSEMHLPSIESVFRDIRRHGMLSPVEFERELNVTELREKHAWAGTDEGKASTKHMANLLDECEILDWDESVATKEEDRKSSHELLELASDGKTPLRMKDGDFVFIDEESCIGCAQCVQVAPGSFAMLESGRARTFQQHNTADVPLAVSVCPVNCMHKVAFHELKEFEIARDHGDGRSDHRHLGHRRGHTPLSVAGIDSDANHKSSWYHYLKHKCNGSTACPKRGCFDCPAYAPGENPYFKELHKKAQKIRARDLIASGEADMWRKTAEL